MRCCRVVAPMWAAVKHPAFAGRALFVVQPIDELGKNAGGSFVAIEDYDTIDRNAIPDMPAVTIFMRRKE